MSVEITRVSKGHCLASRLELPREMGEVFDFFAEARNLEALTPPGLRFEILNPGPVEMRQGTLIDYKLHVHGFPIRWQSEITAWDPPHRFVDEQRRGPYRRWRHEHRFVPTAQGVLVEDLVEYAVPGGRLVHALVVKRDLMKIFGFRREALQQRFGGVGHENKASVKKILPT